ncbi:OsmC family protein [Mesorhizobium sp. 1M-11]|uniref:OsmC family protein n=1 Tax=Mesorhizobium sp. 1M-11 TaxID=1529006 RepID=UPI0006C73925|nr:OsmC family protein [Mesorhizobium sp. 1M-11]
MPVVFGEAVSTAHDIVSVLKKHGDAVRGTYRARYRFDPQSDNPYAGASLERPRSLEGNPADVVFPWEQIFTAAAVCAGSDYPMLAAHEGVDLHSVEFVVEGVFDPRGEFDGLDGLEAPADARHCYLSLHLAATVESSAPRADLERIHKRALSHNMVLGALRGIPTTSALTIRRPVSPETAAALPLHGEMAGG